MLLLLVAYSPRPAKRTRARPAALLWLLIVTATASTGVRAGELQQSAWEAFERAQWRVAEDRYAALGGHDGHHGAGVAALNDDRPADALQHLELAWMLAPTEAQRLDALFNLGHAHAALGRWHTALEVWLAVIAARPDDAAAVRNAELARHELRRLELLDDRAQDLYARRGVLAEGRILPEGAQADDPAATDDDASGGAATIEAAAQQSGHPPPPYHPDPTHLESGRLKVVRLVDDRLRLNAGLLEQDRGVQPPGGEGP